MCRPFDQLKNVQQVYNSFIAWMQAIMTCCVQRIKIDYCWRMGTILPNKLMMWSSNTLQPQFCWFMIVIWPSVYIHPYGIYNPQTRTIQESDSILQKQSRSAKSQVQFKSHHSKKRIKVTDATFFGWKSKGIRETLGVLIYDRHLAVCVYPPLWNLWSPNENYPRELRFPREAI